MVYSAPRGTKDIFGEEAKIRHFLDTKAREIFARWNYQEISTPIFEEVNLFTRSVGETTDIVEKEMYVFKDKRERLLALRPEGTAPVVRAAIENALISPGKISKFFYSGPFYRYERPQAGRQREFYQIGVEFFGSVSPYADFEVLSLAVEYFHNLGLKEYNLFLNNLGCPNCRPEYRKALKDYLVQLPHSPTATSQLCADCQRRIEKNPLRVLDCKIDSKNIHGRIPLIKDYVCESCNKHFQELLALLTENKISYQIDPYLVRGIDYYTRTIFEFKNSVPGSNAGLERFSSGSQDTFAAGGRYDNLVKELGGEDIPAVGWAIGVERLIKQLSKEFISQELRAKSQEQLIYLATIGEKARKEGLKIVQTLRGAGFTVETGLYEEKSLKAQMREADGLKAKYVLILGEDELNRKVTTLRDMQTKEQKEIKLDNLPSELKKI